MEALGEVADVMDFPGARGFAWVLALPPYRNRRHHFGKLEAARRRAHLALAVQGLAPAPRRYEKGRRLVDAGATPLGWRFKVARTGIAKLVDVWPDGTVWTLSRMQ